MTAPAPRPAPGTPRAPALVGRSGELARMARALQSPPAAVVVEGEAGIGKTRLVTEVQDQNGMADFRFLTGTCRRIREPFPLGPVIDALRGVADGLSGARLSPVAGALRPLLPEVAALLPPKPEPLADRVAERHRVFRGLVEVLGALGPAVLVLEDLHWADEQTVDLLSYLLADPPPTLSLVLTYRGDEVDPQVRAVTAKLPDPVTQDQLALAPLDARETGALAAAILGTDRLPEEFATHLWRRTSGLPFAIEEVAALLRARGGPGGAAGGEGWAGSALDELDVPIGIRDPVLGRVARLSGEARLVVEAAAVLQTPAPMSVLVGTCRTARARARRGLAEALESGLLVEQGDEVGFRHLLAAQAVYQGIPGPRRQELHAGAASVLRRRPDPMLGQVAHHLRQADRREAWVEVAQRAADQAVGLGHDTEAARLLTEVLRHGALGPRQRGRVAAKLGRLGGASLAAHAGTLLTEALAADLPRGVRGELRFWLAALLERSGGGIARQRELYAEAVGDLAERPDLQAWAMVGLAVRAVPGTPGTERRRWLARALRVARTIDDPGHSVFLLGKIAMVRAAMGDPSWRHLVDEIEAGTGGAPRGREELRSYLSVGLAAAHAGHHQMSGRLLASGLEGALRGADRTRERAARAHLLVLEYLRGNWEALAGQVDRLAPEVADHPHLLSGVEAVAGCLAAAAGDPGARSRLARITEELERIGALELLPLPVSALARLAVSHGEAGAVLPRLLRLVTTLEGTGYLPLATRVLPAVTATLVTAGQVTQARALVERVDRGLRDLDAPLAPAALHHARGILGSAAARWPAAADHLLAAADRYELLGCRYEAAQAREQGAVCRFAAGDGRAEAALSAALDAYRRLGATWDRDRTAEIARRHGVSVPARHRRGRRGYGSDLSPREREVAALAATGRTNHEIAAELFISSSTVNKHVIAAMRKVGARSRTALAHRVLATAAGQPAKNGSNHP